MRILWFSITPSLFNPHTNTHNGGGWISSLEKIIINEESIQLGVAFEFPKAEFKYNKNNVSYYPIPLYHPNKLEKLFGLIKQNEFINHCLRIIEDFHPDVIQIFGSENDFGILSQYTDIPIVIHMQGCLPPYHNALFPIGMNKYDFFISTKLPWNYRLMGVRSEPSFRKRAQKEIETIQHCNYFMGRTEWDKNLVHLFHPEAKYFHCDEALRDSFLQINMKWEWKVRDKVRIISVISNPWYKGVDLILKTASLLKQFSALDYEWLVYGVQNISFYELKYKINASDVCVKIMGSAKQDELVKALSNSSCYVHPSYIDNSPNSLCEAQYLGVPVLATFVGGIPSLVQDGVTGILFPANAPYTLAGLIEQVVTNKEMSCSLSTKGREVAIQRHNPQTIKDTLIHIYYQILNDK